MIIVVMGEQNLYKYLMMRTINITQPSFGTKEIMLIKIPLTIKNFMHYVAHWTQSNVIDFELILHSNLGNIYNSCYLLNSILLFCFLFSRASCFFFSSALSIYIKSLNLSFFLSFNEQPLIFLCFCLLRKSFWTWLLIFIFLSGFFTIFSFLSILSRSKVKN